MQTHLRRCWGRWFWPILATCLIPACLIPALSFAKDFRIKDIGEIEGQLDLELLYGLQVRLEEPDKDLIGLANGGNSFSTNTDDGNLNYDEGDLTHNLFRVTGELQLEWRNFGLFTRGYAFYDFKNQDNDLERTSLNNDGRDLVGSDVELLDAYLSAQFELPGSLQALTQVRLGDQVVNWGESVFFRGGVNTINPFNFPLFNQPGSSLRDLRRPIGMLWGSAGLTELISVEGFYAYDWDKTLLNPVGGFHNANDITAPGADRVMLGFGNWSDLGTDLDRAFGLPSGTLGFDRDFFALTDIRTQTPSDNGQWGVTVQTIVPQLNDTKLALHFVNYHAQEALISGISPGAEAVAQTSPQAIAARAAELQQQVPGLGDAQALQTAGALIANEFAQNIKVLLEYPENIQMFGFSFNTTTINTGTSFSGEIAHHRGVPLQIDDPEIVFAALSGFQSNPAFRDNQITNGDVIAPDQYIQGFIERDKTQVMLGITQLLGARLGASQTALGVEFGWTHTHDMPSKNELRLNGPGTNTSGNPSQSVLPGVDPDKPAGGAHAGKPAEDLAHFPDADAWGYRLVGTMTYQNVFGGLTMRPRVIWSHDVDGVSPGPGGNFTEGNKSITLGLNTGYLNDTVVADLSYIRLWGGGRYNSFNDRDRIQFSLKYTY